MKKPFRLFSGSLASALLIASAPAHALDLLGAWRLATSSDPNILAAQADVAAAEAARYQAVGGFLPTIGISSTRYNAETGQTYNTVLGPRHSDTKYIGKSDSVNIRQPLLRYERVAQYQQSLAQEVGANANAENERQNLAQRLTGSYLDVLAAIDTKQLVVAQKAAYIGQLLLAERAFAAGTGTRTDVDDARARRDMIIATEIDAESQLNNSSRSLQAIIGESVVPGALKTLRADVNLALLASVTLEEWMERATASNAEVRYAEQQLRVAQLEVNKVRANHLPTIDLFAAHQRNQSDTVNTIGQSSDTTQVGFQLNIPLFSGGQVLAGTDQALARVERARQQLEATRRKLTVSLGKAYDGVKQGRAKIAAAETAVSSTTQALLSTQKGVQAGTRNNVDVLNAQQQEATARRDLARARYEYLISQVSLQIQAMEPADEVIGRLNSFFETTP